MNMEPEDTPARHCALAPSRLGHWKARAEKAEKERDEARADLAEYVQAQALHTQPHPLTPDAITDEMVERALAVERRVYDDGYTTEPGTMRELLTAALTEPTRPEGAEKIEGVLHLYWSGDIDGDDLADRIAEEMNR